MNEPVSLEPRRVTIEVECWDFSDEQCSERIQSIVERVDGKRQHVVNVTCGGVRLRGSDGYAIPEQART